MLTLGIETSCDETSVSLVDKGRVLSNSVSSSVHLHSEYGGVVPEIASRYHVEYLSDVLDDALSGAGKKLDQVELVSVTKGPGLPGSLLVGISFAKAISYSLGVPLVGVDHVKAHLFAAFLNMPYSGIKDRYPFAGIVISGGHTSIFECRDKDSVVCIGRTMDDAIGEAFDKVGKIMDLGYPGGPVVERRAKNFTGKDPIRFTRALMKGSAGIDFSFSGIKTAVMYYWNACEKTEAEKDRICYSFQETVVDIVDRKIHDALARTGSRRLVAGGGVLCNETLRQAIKIRCEKEEVDIFLPEKEYCSDNAAMIAGLGEDMFSCGERSDLFLNVQLGG